MLIVRMVNPRLLVKVPGQSLGSDGEGASDVCAPARDVPRLMHSSSAACHADAIRCCYGLIVDSASCDWACFWQGMVAVPVAGGTLGAVLWSALAVF